MRTFIQWLGEVSKTVLDYLPSEKDAGKPLKDRRDAFKFPFLDKPSFRSSDVKQIKTEYPKVEKWLDKATSKFGVNWLIIYLPPDETTKTIDDPAIYSKAVGVRKTRELGKEGWDKYQPFAAQTARKELDKFLADYQKEGTSVDNTIVYVKPTSRVHGLDSWQQTHNISHGVWGYAREPETKVIHDTLSAISKKVTQNSKVKAAFIKTLREIIYELQEKHYETEGRKPNWVEMVLTLGRVLGVGASFRRLFAIKAGQLDTNYIGNTALNANFQEAMFELMTIYINSGGKFPIKTTGPIKDTPVTDRSAELPRGESGAEIERKFPNAKARDWVYKPLASSQGQWEEAVAKLENILGMAFQSCTWSKIGGPIFATSGFVTTGA